MKPGVVVASIALCCAMVAVPPRVARAAERSADAQRATELFNRSDEAYRGGRFREAVDLLEQAYRLAPDAVLLYNIARAYEGLGDLGAAAASYTAYLRAAPGAADRASVEQRVVALRAAIAERERLRREREAAEGRARAAREQARRQSSANAVPWILAGVGGAGVAAGAVFGLVARARNDAASSAAQVDVARDNSDAHTFATLANVAFIAGGALLATGVVWGILDLRAKRSRADVALVPWIAPGGGGIALRVP